MGLKLTKDMGVKSLKVKSDSQLFIGQVNGTYKSKLHCANKYLEQVKRLLMGFDHFKLERIPRVENDHTDVLIKFASMKLSNVDRSVI